MIDSLAIDVIYDVEICIEKRLEEFRYATVLPEDVTTISFLGSLPITTANTVNLIDRSESVRENSYYFNQGQGDTYIFTGADLTYGASELEGTDVFLPSKGEDGLPVPAWYRHPLPNTATSVKLTSIVRNGRRDVSPTEYVVSLVDSSLYTNLSNEYDYRSGAYQVYFVDVTKSDGTITREILRNEFVFHVATLEDIDLDTGSLKKNSGGYSVSKIGNEFFYEFARSSQKAIRKKKTARISPLVDKDLTLRNDWHLQITNGEFSRVYDSYVYDYRINEFINQDFYPFYPYRRANDEYAEAMSRSLIKVVREDLNYNKYIGLHIDIVVHSSSGIFKGAYSSDSSAISRQDFTWEIREFSVDRKNGIIHVGGVSNILPGDKIQASYFYESTLYEINTIELNPHLNKGVEEFLHVFYIVPNTNSLYSSLYYLKVDKENKIIEAIQNDNGLHEAGHPVSWRPMSKLLADDTYNSLNVISDSYRDYAGSGTTDWVNIYSTEGVNDYQYQIVAEITIINPVSQEDLKTIDTRILGGGIKPDDLAAAVLTEPSLQYTTMDNIQPDGIPYNGYFSILAKVPYTLLSKYGGSFRKSEVIEAIRANAAEGTHIIYELGGVIPRICSVITGTTAGTIDISWMIESSDYNYNVYTSTNWRGPWESTNTAAQKFNPTPVVLDTYVSNICSPTYTVTGLTSGQVYKIAVTAVNTTSGVESPPSTVYEVVAR